MYRYTGRLSRYMHAAICRCTWRGEVTGREAGGQASTGTVRGCTMARAKYFLASLATFSLILLLYLNCSTTKFNAASRFGPVPMSEEEKPFETVEDIGILKGLEVKILSNFKNPCWYEARRDDWQFSTHDLLLSQGSNSVIQQSKKKNSTPSNKVLRCLPYFFLIGQPKCATTDIFHRINSHSDVAAPLLKGPNWWTRKRFGKPYAAQPVPLSDYIDMFNASEIKDKQVSGNFWEYPRITGDGSTSTLWDSSQTMSYLHHLMATHKNANILKVLLHGRKDAKSALDAGNSGDSRGIRYNYVHRQGIYALPTGQNGTVLPFTVADVIHLILPRSRIIAVFREPVARLFSSYLFFTTKNLSPQHFDDDVKSSIQMWNACSKQYSDRICAYNKTLQNSMRVRLYNGLYSIYIRDWLQVFPKEQVLVLRMEDYHKNIAKVMENIYHHLGLKSPTADEKKKIYFPKIHNKSRRRSSVGEMFNSTRKILQEFYKPYNVDLASLLNDPKFIWEDAYENLNHGF